MKQKGILHGHMEDLAAKAIKNGYAVSKFLTPAEAQSIRAIYTYRRDVTLSIDGGYHDAERTRAIFMNPDWGEYIPDEIFAALRITYRIQDRLGHRDILGALMALGIERDTLGDIIVGTHPAAVICLPEISAYIIDGFKKAGRVGVTVECCTLEELPNKTESLTITTDTVASLRLDAVLCAAFGLSRSRAAELIAAGLVTSNYEPCLAPAKEIVEGTVLSVRGLGRAVLTDIGGTSKKGRIYVKFTLYQR